MCFGKDEKNDEPGPRPAQYPLQQQQESKMSYPQQHQQHQPQQQYGPPSGPPPPRHYAPPSGPPPSQQQYGPPSGPPPQQQYAAPMGPPPSQQGQFSLPPPGPPGQQQFAPPSGPPPTQQYAPPPGPPPPSHVDYTSPPPGEPPSDKSKVEHDWQTAVPDTSLFPPPPAFFQGWDRSPANNATEEESRRGTEWCNQYPLTAPITVEAAGLEALRTNNFRLMQPWGFQGELTWRGAGMWDCRTARHAPDSTILSYPPLYAVTLHSPLATGQKKTIYYEVTIRHDSRNEVSLAMGFAALPYPNFRLPGWHRGSMAVHGDDGHRYVNDTWGGASFTQPFRRGDTYGVGMTFEPKDGRIAVNCFFTRNGAMDGSWDLHEEQDADVNLPVFGLEGYHDLGCAIGTFDMVSFEVVFDPARWRYVPS